MPLRIDLHVHTNHSPDSLIRPFDLIKKSKSTGVVPSITDHNSISSFSQFKGHEYIAGEEIRVGENYDLICLYINELIPYKTPFIQALDMIKEQGAISYLPHMYDITRKGCHDTKLASMADIIEVFNGRAFGNFNKKAADFAKEHKKLKGVGSDTHFLFEYGNTHVQLPGNFSDYDDNPNQFLRDLSDANLFTKHSPIFVRGTTTLVKYAKKLLPKSFIK